MYGFVWVATFAAMVLFGAATIWAIAIISDSYSMIGSLGGRGDWIWVILDVLTKTSALWIGGCVAVVLAFAAFILANGPERTLAESKERDC